MSWNNEQTFLNAAGEWQYPVSNEPQQAHPSAGTLLNNSIAQLDYAAQEASLYMTNEQSCLWPYEIGIDSSYSVPGSSVSSQHLDEIDWQEDVAAGEGPSPSSDDKKKQSRRKEQNRSAQRAFRERKDRALVELQEAVKSSKDRAAELEAENIRLKDKLKESKLEIDTLRSVSMPPLQVAGGNDVGTNVSATRMTDENEDVILVKIKLDKAEGAER